MVEWSGRRPVNQVVRVRIQAGLFRFFGEFLLYGIQIITLVNARMCLQVKKIELATRSLMAQPAVPSRGNGRTKKARVQIPQGACICLQQKNKSECTGSTPG